MNYKKTFVKIPGRVVWGESLSNSIFAKLVGWKFPPPSCWSAESNIEMLHPLQNSARCFYYKNTARGNNVVHLRRCYLRIQIKYVLVLQVVAQRESILKIESVGTFFYNSLNIHSDWRFLLYFIFYFFYNRSLYCSFRPLVGFKSITSLMHLADFTGGLLKRQSHEVEMDTGCMDG